MRQLDTSPLARYGIALAAIGIAIGLRYALQPWLGPTFPLATMFTAIAFVVWRAGWGPALLTTVGGWAAANFVFRGGVGFFGGLTLAELIGFLTYLIATIPIIVLGEAMTRARRALEADHAQLSTTNVALANKVEAQSLLAAIVASSEDAIVSKTLDGVITSWNRGAERLFGWSAAEAIGASIQLIVPAESRDQARGFLERVRRGERIEHLDVSRLRKDGSRIHVSISISPVYDRHGHIIGASKTARDVTSRRQWEEGLVRSEEAQRLLVGIHDATRGLDDPAGVMREIVTRVGRHFDVTRCAYGEVDVNQNQILITPGYTKDLPTVAGRYPLDVFGPPLIDELKAGRTAVIDDVRHSPLTDTDTARETYARMRIGSLICVPLVRGGQLIAILVMCDSTRRAWQPGDAPLLEQVAERTLFAVDSARAAQELREQRDVMHLAMKFARMGAWTRDLVLDRMWLSPELAEIMGVTPTPGTMDRAPLLSVLQPKEIERLQTEINAAIAEHRDYTLEFEFRHGTSGEWRWAESRGRAVYGPDGKPTMLYGLGMDVTERHRAVEALQEADRRKDEFLATLAHELRNPLAPISSGLQILRSAKDPKQAAMAVDIMERQVGQMVRLVDDLLDVARITTGKVEIHSEPIDLALAVDDAIETSAPIFTQRGQQFTADKPERPVFVNGDRTRLAQVFANLLNNSARYSDPGQSITLTIERDGDDAVVRVRDNGIGIRPDLLPRVFEMFRQVDRERGRSRGGLGIGLSLVKRIVDMHGGVVIARSDGLNHGSEFTVRLPALSADQVIVARNASASNGRLPRRKILVVDDNEDAAESLAALLTLGGHETRMAHDGQVAFAQAAQFQPDVVFLDIGMPALDGHETARRIRQQPWGKDMVLIALTGWGQHEDRRRSQEAGFNHHLVKPADPAAVAELLASLN